LHKVHETPLLATKTSRSNPSDQRLAATIGKNTFFGVISSGAQIGTRLITVPVVIHHLGLDGYGIWAIIISTAAYMRFGSAGIRSAFQKYVAEATGNGNFAIASRLVSTGSISMLVFSLVALIPFAIYSKNLATIAGVPPAFLNAAAASITVLAVIYAISNFGAAFEAILMGGHRIDLTKKYSTILTVCEAVIIILILHFGYGLFAMTLVMGLSELVYIFCCYRASHRVVPKMQVGVEHFTKSTFPELLRFAGSYQLINVLELLYGAILPIIILKVFGAPSAGVFAVATRVVASALVAQEALVLPILSGGTMVFASGSRERINHFLAKSFKVTVAASLPPLACVATFGTTMIFAWTGQTDHLFRMAIWLSATAALLKAISLLQLILYRASGRALLDNIRQVLRIVAILLVALCSRRIGFSGVLIGIAGAEFVGVMFMFLAMAHTFRAFSPKIVIFDTLRISTATLIIVGTGALAELVPIPWNTGERLTATIKLGEIFVGCLIVAWPALTLSKSISASERRTILDTLSFRQRKALAAE
jgi:O-antigen/teichoic acid export membrane protein